MQRASLDDDAPRQRSLRSLPRRSLFLLGNPRAAARTLCRARDLLFSGGVGSPARATMASDKAPLRSPPLRSCLGLLFCLIALGYGGYRWPAAPTQSTAPSIGAWRHTADGWERRSVWGPRIQPFLPLIHPATLTAFASLATLIALIALAPAQPPAISRASPPGWHVSRLQVVQRRAPFVERRRTLALDAGGQQTMSAARLTGPAHETASHAMRPETRHLA